MNYRNYAAAAKAIQGLGGLGGGGLDRDALAASQAQQVPQAGADVFALAVECHLAVGAAASDPPPRPDSLCPMCDESAYKLDRAGE